MENKEESIWKTLSPINVNDYVEKKKSGDGIELSYLSWAWAWGCLMEHYPTATFQVREWDGKPWLFDPNLGYIVQTSVTVEGITRSMWLPVMNGSNKAQKNVAYTYKTRNGEKSVEPATMFDINTAIMRCMVKNLALFGLGHYIYAGEDLPEAEAVEKREKEAKELTEAFEKVKACTTKDEVKKVYAAYPQYKYHTEFHQLVIEKGQSLPS